MGTSPSFARELDRVALVVKPYMDVVTETLDLEDRVLPAYLQERIPELGEKVASMRVARIQDSAGEVLAAADEDADVDRTFEIQYPDPGRQQELDGQIQWPRKSSR
jgi:hypothetical protein